MGVSELPSLSWTKSSTGASLPLKTVNLSNVTTIGVYVIWHAGNPSRVVSIGKGDIVERLSIHRSDPKILAYRAYGILYATWAAVPGDQMDGVERYLANCYKPLVAKRYPTVVPIQVNLPTAA